MANLLNSLSASAGALAVFDRVLEVAQNNVANASTPGFVKQRQSLQALPFDPAGGLQGGVRAGAVESARSVYADESVRRETVLLGQAQQDVNSLNSLQSVFDISGNSGIPKALNDLFTSFSSWAQAPNDTVQRQMVLERATDLAQSFQQTSANLTRVAQESEDQVQQTVDTVNRLVGQLQVCNAKVLAGTRNDPGLDATLHSTLEELAQYAGFTTLEQDDGTVSVLLNGQTPLLVGDHQYEISAAAAEPATPPPVFPDARPSIRILASDGSDITAATTGGQLGSLLDFHNRLLPSYLGDAYQQGDLNRMAQQFADRVNQLLTAGNISDGPPPQPGVPLFTYDPAAGASVAATLAVNPGITADQLAPIDPGPPYTANGVALALSALENPKRAADEMDGDSFTEFYGRLAARAGDALSAANNQLAVQQSAVAQSKNLRQQMSGVSLDEEATILIQFQRAYEANARLITIMDQLTQDTINILQP